MSDTFNKIKEELSVYYPDVTDDELFVHFLFLFINYYSILNLS